jgi:hypothetical protein
MENTTLPPTQITVADLDALRAIVDLAAQRGAFRGAELQQVGTVFDKLTTFLDSIVAAAKAAAEDDEGTTDEVATSETTQGE